MYYISDETEILLAATLLPTVTCVVLLDYFYTHSYVCVLENSIVFIFYANEF